MKLKISQPLRRRSTLLFAFIQLLFCGENPTNKFPVQFSKALKRGEGNNNNRGEKNLNRRKGVKGKKEMKMQKAKKRRGKPQGAFFLSAVPAIIYARFRGACMRNRKLLFMGLFANAPAALMRGAFLSSLIMTLTAKDKGFLTAPIIYGKSKRAL